MHWFLVMSSQQSLNSSRSSTLQFNELANFNNEILRRSNSVVGSCSTIFGDDDEEQLWFADDQLAAKVFPRFEEIRRIGKLCDVTLIVGGRHLSAHRIVLAATIPYFQAMFTHDMVESNQREISMQVTETKLFS